MAEKPATSPCDSDEAATAGHPTPETTAAKPPAPHPTSADGSGEEGVNAEALEQGPGHAR